MALKDKVQAAQASQDAAQATAPVAAPTTAKGTSSKTEAFKAKGAAMRAQMTEDQKAIEGSKSDKVAFICALGNPAIKQPRVEGGSSLPSFAVVGYKFRILEDMSIPYAPYKKDGSYKIPLDVEEATERQVKAGTEVALNIVETAMLISRVEFAGRFSGEGTQVAMSVKMSNDRPDPLPILNKVGAGSIKDNMELVADMIGGDGTAKNRGTAKVKPEYEDTFGGLFIRNHIKKGTGAVRKAGEGQADIAAAFRAYYANRK